MNKEKQKKILKFMKSNAFCNSFLILCSIIGTAISLKAGVNPLNILGFPIAFTIGVNGLIFIPMVCDKKLAELDRSMVNEIKIEEMNQVNNVKIEVMKRTNNSSEEYLTLRKIHSFN